MLQCRDTEQQERRPSATKESRSNIIQTEPKIGKSSNSFSLLPLLLLLLEVEAGAVYLQQQQAAQRDSSRADRQIEASQLGGRRCNSSNSSSNMISRNNKTSNS